MTDYNRIDYLVDKYQELHYTNESVIETLGTILIGGAVVLALTNTQRALRKYAKNHPDVIPYSKLDKEKIRLKESDLDTGRVHGIKNKKYLENAFKKAGAEEVLFVQFKNKDNDKIIFEVFLFMDSKNELRVWCYPEGDATLHVEYYTMCACVYTKQLTDQVSQWARLTNMYDKPNTIGNKSTELDFTDMDK